LVNPTKVAFSAARNGRAPVDPRFLDQLARMTRCCGLPFAVAHPHVAAVAVSARREPDEGAGETA